MRKVINVVVFLFWFIWQLPQNIVALILMLYWKKKNLKHIAFYKHCHAYCVKNFNAGISLGNFCFVGYFYDLYCTEEAEAYLMHELKGHTFQSRLLGPLYLIVIGIPSFIHNKMCADYRNYYNFYTEKWANNVAGIYYNTYIYGLKFKPTLTTTKHE